MADDYLAMYDKLDDLLDDLVEAAIKADMYHRDFKAQDGAQVFYNYMLYKEVHRGNPGANDMGDTDDTTDYESAVFAYWPAKIDEIFSAWKSDKIPGPTDFDPDIEALAAATNPIAMPSKLVPAGQLKKAGFAKGQMPDTGVGDALVSIHRRMGDLEGGWVDGFHDQYVTVVPWVIGNQKAMLDILIGSLQAEQDLWSEVRKTVAGLAVAGKAWFEALIGKDNAFEIVVSLAGALYGAYKDLPDLLKDPKGALVSPLDTFGTLTGLYGSGDSVVSKINEGEPLDLGAMGYPETVASAQTRLGQTLEYTVCTLIKDQEQQLADALTQAVSAMSSNPGTFSMASGHLEDVATVADVMAPKQVTLSRIAVDEVILSLQHAGSDLALVTGGFKTSVGPWIRPAAIGIGATGPYPQLLALENAVVAAIHETSTNLEAASTAVRLAADLMYDMDGVSTQDLKRANDRLDALQERLAGDLGPTPNAPTGPWVYPDGTVYQDVPDCGPATDDPLSGPAEPEYPFLQPPVTGDGTSIGPRTGS